MVWGIISQLLTIAALFRVAARLQILIEARPQPSGWRQRISPRSVKHLSAGSGWVTVLGIVRPGNWLLTLRSRLPAVLVRRGLLSASLLVFGNTLGYREIARSPSRLGSG